MYSFPSTSKMWDPTPRAMNGGVPPTPRKARTGEFTPPGISFWAQANSSADRECFISRADARVRAGPPGPAVASHENRRPTGALAAVQGDRPTCSRSSCLFRDHSLQKHVHQHFLQRAIQIAK